MENLKVHRALKRSSVLTKGGIGRIFVMLLLVVAVMMVIQYAIQIPMFILLWKSKGVPTLTTQIVASFGSFSQRIVRAPDLFHRAHALLLRSAYSQGRL